MTSRQTVNLEGEEKLEAEMSDEEEEEKNEKGVEKEEKH